MYVENGILNELNLEMNSDGSFDAYFGECGEVKNNLPTVEDWNYILRIYEPRLDELQEFRIHKACSKSSIDSRRDFRNLKRLFCFARPTESNLDLIIN